MGHGLSRATPYAVVGFCAGALLTVLLRFLQGVDPIWQPDVAAIMGTLVATVFFVIGMGAFDPSLSEHGEHDEHGDDHAADAHGDAHGAAPSAIVPAGSKAPVVKTAVAAAEVPPPPTRLLIDNTFNMFGWLMLVLGILVVVMAVPFGPALTSVGGEGGNGNVRAIGMFEMAVPADWQEWTYNGRPVFGETIVVSQLVVFFIFVAIVIGSLMLIGGAVGWATYNLSTGLKEVKTIPRTPQDLRPPWPVRKMGDLASWLLARLPEPPQPKR
jgi:hypothetical protein